MEKYAYIRLDQKEEWVVSMHPDAPLADREYITPRDLADVPLILPRRLDVRSQLASWFGQWFDDLNVLFTSNLPAASSVMASRQLAYSINIRGSLSFYDERKVVCRPLRPRLTATSVLAWRRKQPFGVAAAKFIEHAGTALRQTADISE